MDLDPAKDFLQSCCSQRKMFVCDISTLPIKDLPSSTSGLPFSKSQFEASDDEKAQHQMLYDLLAETKSANKEEASFVLAVLSSLSSFTFYRVNTLQAKEISALRPRKFFYVVFSERPTDLRVWVKMNVFLFTHLHILPAEIHYAATEFYCEDSGRQSYPGFQLAPYLISIFLHDGGFYVLSRYLVALFRNGSLSEALQVFGQCDYFKMLQDYPERNFDNESEKAIQLVCSIVTFPRFSLGLFTEVLNGPLDPEKCYWILLKRLPTEVFAGFKAVSSLEMCIKEFANPNAFDQFFALIEFLSTPGKKIPTEYKAFSWKDYSLMVDYGHLSSSTKVTCTIALILNDLFQPTTPVELSHKERLELDLRCEVFLECLDESGKMWFLARCKAFKNKGDLILDVKSCME